ncbi:unnamed protein product [Rhodiola kirilowii]
MRIIHPIRLLAASIVLLLRTSIVFLLLQFLYTISNLNSTMNNRISKRCKSISISQWLRSDVPSSVSKSEHHKARNLDPSSLILSKDDQKKRIEDEAISDTTSLERDPGKRQSIGKYPLNERDYVRRAYILLGLNQPHLKCIQVV